MADPIAPDRPAQAARTILARRGPDGWYERLRDQLYLPAGEATEEEILLRRRQLATGFQYFASMGLSYTIGSRFRTVVNSRFPNAVN